MLLNQPILTLRYDRFCIVHALVQIIHDWVKTVKTHEDVLSLTLKRVIWFGIMLSFIVCLYTSYVLSNTLIDI